MHTKNPAFIIGFLFCFNCLAWLAVWQMSQPRFLKVVFFNVGQGDSVFIEGSQGHQILIDGGPDSAVLEKLGREMPFWDRTIDLVILTHPDYDHMRGLLDVLDRYEVENILWTGVQKQTEIFKKWLKQIKEEGAKVVIAQRGQKIKAGQANLYVLYPFDNLEGELVEKDANDTSVVVKLLFRGNAFLFPGDITKKAESLLLQIGSDLSSEVLKTAHHGSNMSGSEEFLERVNPQTAVISCAKDNEYGHPHQEVLARLEKFGIRVLRTDRDGDINILSDGNNLNIKTQNTK